MAGQFSGKVAVVTGAASGMGRASALAFAREGAKVIVADVVVAGGEETVRMVTAAGGDALFVKTDVSKAAEVKALIDKAVATYGRLDYAHNNAGIEGTVAPTADYTEEEWQRVLNVNLTGVWLCIKYEILQMRTQGGGAIVNTASIAGLTGFENFPAYTAAKHGVVGLTKAAALEYAKAGIRINAVCPGAVRTPMNERLIGGDPKVAAQMDAMQPLGRRGTSEEIAEVVVWLCSRAASFVTGLPMAVDGGMLSGMKAGE